MTSQVGLIPTVCIWVYSTTWWRTQLVLTATVMPGDLRTEAAYPMGLVVSDKIWLLFHWGYQYSENTTTPTFFLSEKKHMFSYHSEVREPRPPVSTACLLFPPKTKDICKLSPIPFKSLRTYFSQTLLFTQFLRSFNPSFTSRAHTSLLSAEIFIPLYKLLI